MSFVQWLFLLGAAGVAGPLVAHLLAKPRYRRVPFTMLRFLEAGRIETHARRRLRDLLILALRCLIIVLVAMLFARPLLVRPPQQQKQGPVYYLGLDDSASMGYSDGSGSYFQKMVEAARRYVRAGEDAGVFNICTLASGKRLGDLDKASALAELDRLGPSALTAQLEDFAGVVRQAARNGHSKQRIRVLLVSDFTPAFLETLNRVDSPVTVNKVDWHSVVSTSPINDAAVTDAQLTVGSEGTLAVSATVVNYGQVKQRRRLTASLGRGNSVSRDVEIGPGQKRTFAILFNRTVEELRRQADELGGRWLFIPLELSLSAGDGLAVDDKYYVAAALARGAGANVLLVESSPDQAFLLKTAFAALSRTNVGGEINVRQVRLGESSSLQTNGADVIIFSTISGKVGSLAGRIRKFLEDGGKVVFFTSTELSAEAVERLWSQGLLAALPGKCVRRVAYVEPRACGVAAGGADAVAAESLSNYRIDKIPLTGYLECRQHADSVCTWRLQNGFGFIYTRKLGNGSSVLVNTSIDDSLGSLTKSAAAVAFCRYLLGRTEQLKRYCFFCGQVVELPASDTELRAADKQQFWVDAQGGSKVPARVVDSRLVVTDTHRPGWIRTLTVPRRYAGVNIEPGETNMAKPAPAEITAAVGRVFVTTPPQQRDTTSTASAGRYKPLWRFFAWAIIALLVVEPAIANRLKR